MPKIRFNYRDELGHYSTDREIEVDVVRTGLGGNLLVGGVETIVQYRQFRADRMSDVVTVED
jgi:hypothetical protein